MVSCRTLAKAAMLVLALTTSDARAVVPHDACGSPYIVTGLPFQHTVDFTTAMADPPLDPFTCVHGFMDAEAPTVWYAFTADHAMTLAVDTLESWETGLFDATAITAYRGTCGALEPIACNQSSFDDYYGQNDLSSVIVPVLAGETVLVRVFSQSGVGAVTVTFRDVPAFPVSTQDPEHINGHPAVAMQADGGFLVVWRENMGSTVPRFPAIAARRYDATGAAQGAAFAVNAGSAHGAYHPEVDADGLGNFVVAWGSFSTGVWARRLDPAGTPLGADIAVAASFDRHVDVAADADGDFVVVWREAGIPGGDVSAQRFDATGAPVGGPIAVQAGGLEHPRVGMADDGRFVVAWVETAGLDGSLDGVFARLYDAAGTAVGGAFQVNETTTGRQGDEGPAVSMAPDGTFVVVWGDDAFVVPGCFSCVRARRFDAGGTPLGGEFKVNEDDASVYYQPAVAHDADGGFIVQWARDGDGPMLRRFDAAGAPRSAQVYVSHVDKNYQDFGDVAAGDDGFVVVWDQVPVYSDVLVYGRRFPPEGAPDCGEPRTGCRTTSPGKSSLVIIDTDPNKGDRLTWKWTKGQATSPADVGNPTAGDSYSLCLYEGIGPSNSLRASVPGGGTCGTSPCWKSVASGGFRYVDKKAFSEGVQKLILKPGSDGTAKMIFKGKGTRLRGHEGQTGDPLLPISAAPTVLVQLVSGTGVCWEAVYDAGITTSTSSKFVATSD